MLVLRSAAAKADCGTAGKMQDAKICKDANPHSTSTAASSLWAPWGP